MFYFCSLNCFAPISMASYPEAHKSQHKSFTSSYHHSQTAAEATEKREEFNLDKMSHTKRKH